MTDIGSFKTKVIDEVDKILPRLIEMSDWIGKHPELGSEEVEASKLLAHELEKQGFKVEMSVYGMPTAFKAVYKGKKKGPVIAFLSEYDALPGVGHGCGHNIIGTASVGAGVAVSRMLKDLPGEVWVLGTPAEEGHGPSASAKAKMVKQGAFKGVDVAMMVHPMSMSTMVSMSFLAIAGITLEFTGKTAHAAADAHNGNNALNAAMITYMAIHANRQQLRRDANPVVHGIVTEGGLASNIIPDRAVLRFGVRSSDTGYIPTLIEMVSNSAKAGALATGCEVTITVSEGMKANIRNPPLEKLLFKEFTELGVEVEAPEVSAARPPAGSTDFADVTHVIPGIHPMIGIAGPKVGGHSRELAAATFTTLGHKGLENGAKAMAMGCIELLSDAKLLNEVKDAFAKTLKQPIK